ncbi:MAG: hypothetical protein JWP76_4889 [Dactylosporangium sp.]|jgi:hypothetical protein|nr:hypothetical protein [Dactylosporangium sp.]
MRSAPRHRKDRTQLPTGPPVRHAHFPAERVHEPDVEQLVHNYRLREPDAGEQRGRAEASVRYSDWLAEQAARHGIPVISARPWDTALDRLYELLD